MHGIRKNSQKAKTPEEIAAQEVKVAKYAHVRSMLCADFIKPRRFTLEGLCLSTPLVKLNPEYLMIWNYRKHVILEIHREIVDLRLKSDGVVNLEQQSEQWKSIVLDELTLTQEGLLKNPKSYATWHHRQWLFATFASYEEAKVIGEKLLWKDMLCKEVQLCDQLLELDERNFHCWNYRRFVGSLLPDECGTDKELAYSKKKIDQNFSNYSAFHYRAHLLSSLTTITLETLHEEIEMIQQAVFTEPDDQTAWFYYRWLVSQLKLACPNVTNLLEIFSDQIHWLQDLIELESTAKWAIYTLACIHEQILTLWELDQHVQKNHHPNLEGKVEECRALYEKLTLLDPWHRGLYADQILGLKRFEP